MSSMRKREENQIMQNSLSLSQINGQFQVSRLDTKFVLNWRMFVLDNSVEVI